MKKIILISFCALFGVQRMSAQEAYAVYEDSTMTFYYDTMKSSRTGEVFGSVGERTGTPGWYKNNDVEKGVTKVVFDSSFAYARPKSTKYWFHNMVNLKEIVDVKHLNTSEVATMEFMFDNCSKLKSIDVSNFNTENVFSMYAMFSECKILTSLDVSSFNTANVVTMSNMFSGCHKLTSLELSNFNTSKVEVMSFMFDECYALEDIDVSSFNTAKVESMRYLFYKCRSLKKLKLGNFNTSKVTDMEYMFYQCSSLKAIYVGSEWNTDLVSKHSSMFYGCEKLVGGKGTKYNSQHSDKAYAHIDGGESNPGYLTDEKDYAIYDLYVGGTQVETCNMFDILEDGFFSYDADNNVLSIKGNYNYDHYEGFIINYLPDLTVYVATDATIECKGAAFITMANLTITGPGRLTLRSETDCGIYARSGSCVTLDGINLDAQGEWAISGQPKGEKLLIRNSTIKAVTTSSSYSAICDFTGGITLEGCKITKPVGGKIQGGNIVAADGSVTQEIVIEMDNPYDLNNDGKVSTADIQVIINEMKKPQSSQNMMYDLNADGKISTADIQVIINEMKK